METLPYSKRRSFWQRQITIGRMTLFIGVLLLTFGPVSWADLAQIGQIVTLPMAGLLGLSIIALSVHEVGIFRWAAVYVARQSGGSGVRLFTNLYILSAVVTVLFPNDATILLFTPLVLHILHKARDKTWDDDSFSPFLFTIVFGANAASIALVTSNPINMIYASYFELAYLRYASLMMLPGLVSTLVCYGLLRLVFRDVLPKTYCERSAARERPIDRPFIIAVLVVVGMFVSYFVLSALALDYSIAILVSSLIMLWPVMESRKASVGRVLRGLPWDAVLFVVGMFTIVFAFTNLGWTVIIDRVLAALTAVSPLQMTVGSGLFIALGTNLINDWPMASLSSVAIGNLSDVSARVHDLLVYTAVISANLGNKILPTGSLATLIWVGVIGRMSGIHIRWGQFIRVGLIVTPLTLLAALFTLWLELFVIG